MSLKKTTKKTLKYVISHAFIFGLVGFILAFFLHHYLWTMRITNGVFSSAWLISGTEFAWYMIGASILLVVTSIGGVVGYHRSK